MASTYSPILRTELIGAGDQAGSWGSTTNNSFQYIFESAIAGYQAVTVSPTSNNQILTYVNGATANPALDQSIYAMLKLVAGTVGANFNIFAPPVSKTFIIWNNTGYTATFYNSTIIGNTTAAGSGIVIPTGAKVQIWSDGTNFYSGFDTTAGNLTISGNLVVNGTTTLTGATTLSSAITYGGVTLSNAVTGTGGMVLSVSPTFTGTPIAPTATTGTNTTQIATTAFVQAAGAALNLGTMATQNANAVAITGGTMSGMTSIAGGTVSGTTGTFSGAVSGTTGTFTGAVSGTTITASTQFSGPGTGLSGTAASLSIGGSAASATNATNLTGSGTISSTTTGTTQALGTNNTTIATTAFALANGIPSGAIVMWSGSIASIPSGWLLCNGASGTPDLRDRFVVGAGSTYAVAATGGTADAVVVSHTHTATVTDPGHTHATSPATSLIGTAQQNAPGGAVANPGTPSTLSIVSATTGISVANSTTGVSGTGQNLPPYYALAYIMKA